MNLDTVGCSIAILEKNIKEWERFSWRKDGFPVSEVDVLSFSRRSNVKLTLKHPNTERLGTNWHYPTLTLIKREGWWWVWVEGSLSKFYFGTNLFELTNKDFESVVTKLHHFLYDNGLHVERSDIYGATMFKADISKIILVEPEIPILKVLDYMGKMDLDIRNETHVKIYADFRQGGKGNAVIWGTTKKKLASFYDKLTELRHYPKKTKIEENIISFLDENKDCLYQVLKFEECLHDKKRLNIVCNKITGQKKKYFTLLDFLNEDFIRKLLLFRGERLFASTDITILLLGNHSSSQIQHELKKHNPKMRAGRLSSIAHWTGLAYELGMKEMKKQLRSDFSHSTQCRILQETRGLMETMTQLPMQDVFTNFYHQLQDMKPIQTMNDLLLPFWQ